MIKRSIQSLASTWLAGLLVLLPLALTAAMLAWVFGLINRFVGPGSFAGGISRHWGTRSPATPGSRTCSALWC